MAAGLVAHARCVLTLPRWRRGSDGWAEEVVCSGTKRWRAAPAPRGRMIPTEEVSARRREIEDKLKQVGLGKGPAPGRAGPGLGPRPEP